MPNLTIASPQRGRHKIIFLHGGPGMDDSYFRPYFTDLEKDFFCAYYTQGDGGDFSLKGLLAELDLVRQKICGKNEKVVLLGHSFGGTLALEYIRKHGEKNILALVALGWNYNTALRLQFMRATDKAEETPQLELPLDYDDAQYKQDMIHAVDLYFTRDKRDEGLRLFKNCQFNAALSHKIHHEFLHRYDGIGALKNISVPTLCLYGEEDKIITPKYIRHGLKLNPRILGHEIYEVGHFPFVEKPTEVNFLIRDFLSAIQDPSPPAQLSPVPV